MDITEAEGLEAYHEKLEMIAKAVGLIPTSPAGYTSADLGPEISGSA